MDGDEPEPTLLDLESAQQEARREAAVSDQAAQLGTRSVRRLVERHIRWYALAAIAFSVAISVAAVYLASAALSQASATEALRMQRDDQTRAAMASLSQSNAALKARGQPIVSVPSNGDPSDAISAAVTARVISQLPKAPTAEQVAAVIGPVAAVRVTGPTSTELAAATAAYYGQNPPAAGAPGPGPSADQIDAAVAARYAANPPAAGRDGVNGTNGEAGPAGPAGRGQVGSMQDPDDPCVRIVRFDQAPFEERWNTCPAGSRPGDAGGPTTEPPPTTE